MAPFEIVDHTADVGLHVSGESLGQLFADAASGMFSIISEQPPEGWPESHDVKLDAPDVESLIADWLSELLYLFEVKKFFTTGAEIKSIGENKLEAAVRGVRLRGVMCGTEIKAVTQHLLSVDRTIDGFETTIYFDL
jgi:SHS2 domain-containing protein